MKYPRPITSIHQIEVTSRCNLRCVYCPSPKLDTPIEQGGHGRAKQDMTLDTYRRALEWAAHFDGEGTQGELSLTGIGEGTLHPEFVQLVRLAREALPDNPIVFSTNGLLVDDDLCERLKPYNPRIFVSLHRPEKAKGAIDAARRWELLAGTNDSFATNAFDWAGALDWAVSIPAESVPCAYLGLGWSVVLADGQIVTCCLDSTGASGVGHVDDEIGSLSIEPWQDERTGAGCEQCHMVVP